MTRKIALNSLLVGVLLSLASPAGPALAASARRHDTRGRQAGAARVGAAAAPADGALTPSPTHRRRAGLGARGISLATWFGPGFFGHQTACGQVLTLQLAGVANRRLPCGTLVDVSYQGRNVVLPVIDRGPYGVKHARWDLTERAAQMLEITETVAVHARIVGHVSNSPSLGLVQAAEATPQPALQAGGVSG